MSTKLAILDVGSTPGSNSLGFSGSVDGDENNICRLDFGINVSGEEKIPSTRALYDVKETRLVNGQVVSVPCINLLLIEIDDAYANL